jgi:hypothetical protein
MQRTQHKGNKQLGAQNADGEALLEWTPEDNEEQLCLENGHARSPKLGQHVFSTTEESTLLSLNLGEGCTQYTRSI